MNIMGQSPWRFRWVFDYYDGKLSKRGVWNGHSETDNAASAFLANKSGLLFAAVEAQDRDKTEIKRVAECPGQDFCNFQWISTAFAPGLIKGSIVVDGIITGIVMLTRDKEIYFYSSGESKICERKYADNLYHFGGLNNA